MASFRAGWSQVMWLFILFLPAASAVVARAIDQKKDVDVNYVSEMLDKLKVFVQQQTVATQAHFDSEVQRLRGAMTSVPVGPSQQTIQDALQKVETERIEAEAASLEAMQYYHTVRAAMGSQSGAPSCDFLSCGRHASCRVKENGRAFCECATCFAGDGFTCRPSACMPDTFYTAQPILPKAVGVVTPEPRNTSEVSLTLLDEEHVLVAIRDEQQGNRGFLILGKMGAKDIEWSEWQSFSGDLKAFAPVVTGFANGRFLVGFRDGETSGVGYLASGQVVSDPIEGVKVVIGVAHGFVKHQEQKFALVPLSSSRAVCLYADHILETDGAVRQRSGGAALVEVLAGGALSMLGKYHFAIGAPIQHLAATRTAETEFMVTYRSVPPDDAETGQKSQELAVAWMEVSKDNLLVINPHPLFLESEQPDILQRDIALVSQNLVSLSYYTGGSRKNTKTTLVRWDPSTQRISEVGNAAIIGSGEVSYVSAISLPGDRQVPSTFTYFQPVDAHGVAEVCGVDLDGDIIGCKDLKWTDEQLKSAGGIRLPDGRLLLAFASSGGAASTRFISAEEASAQDVAAVV